MSSSLRIIDNKNLVWQTPTQSFIIDLLLMAAKWLSQHCAQPMNLWFIHHYSPTNLFQDFFFFFCCKEFGARKTYKLYSGRSFPCVNIWKEELFNNTHFFSMLPLKLYLSTILPKINCQSVIWVPASLNNISITVPMTPLNCVYFLDYSWSSSLSDFFIPILAPQISALYNQRFMCSYTFTYVLLGPFCFLALDLKARQFLEYT